MAGPKRVICAIGTRPEAIKMAPVYTALRSRGMLPLLFLTGQHREQLQQALTLFELPVEADLAVMTERQTLPSLAGRIIPAAAEALLRLAPDYVLVHGDTLTTFAVAWAAFLERIPFGHVEAGLRSHSLAEPFPEEANRKLTDTLADACFAPTPLARRNLLREGIDEERILVTGQTGIDAIRHAASVKETRLDLPEGPYVTITLHRRESIPHLQDIAGAIARIAARFPERRFVYPIHLNPAVRDAVRAPLSGHPNVLLTDPLEYGAMAQLLAASDLLITDSGGLQEEGAALRVPVVVVRNVTERPEGVDAGILKLASTDPETIYRIVCEILENPTIHQTMRSARNPYGDGQASERVAAGVEWRISGGARPADWQPAG